MQEYVAVDLSLSGITLRYNHRAASIQAQKHASRESVTQMKSSSISWRSQWRFLKPTVSADTERHAVRKNYLASRILAIKLLRNVMRKKVYAK